MTYWLVKSEPETFSWDTFVTKGGDCWDGVRNYQARNNLKAMQKGDHVLFYHSGEGKEIVGICEVIKEFYQDPTTDDTNWVVVDLKPIRPLQTPVKLSAIKQHPDLQAVPLIRHTRLSVMPLQEREFEILVGLGG